MSETVMTYNNTVMSFGATPKWMAVSPNDPYNPLGLPPYTIRLKFTDGVTPSFSKGTAVQVSLSPNVWDLTYENADWSNLLLRQYSLAEVLGANTSLVTGMSGVFRECTALTTVPLFDTSSATNTGTMFQSCTSLTAVPLFDTSSVTRMETMFAECTALTTVPLFDTGSVTRMSSMFQSCTSLTAVPLFDTGSVTLMAHMFYGCTSLTTVPLFDTGSVTTMSSMFRECRALTSVPLFDTSRAKYMDYMFYNCYNIESGSYALYQQASAQSTPPIYHSSCFTNCGANTTTGAAELAQIPTSWGGTMS